MKLTEECHKMERLFNKFQGMKIVHSSYTGVLCGYNNEHFIIAVENNPLCSFRRLCKDSFILDEYKDTKYRYVYEDEKAFNSQLKITL